MATTKPTERILNKSLTQRLGQDIVKLEVIEVTEGATVGLRFEGARDDWRQGVWVGTDGALAIAGAEADQMALWTDTAPRVVDIGIERTDGLLRLYNIWDSGRGVQPWESQSASSGMLRDEQPDGWVRYRCSDIAADPSFDSLVFSVRVSGGDA